MSHVREYNHCDEENKDNLPWRKWRTHLSCIVLPTLLSYKSTLFVALKPNILLYIYKRGYQKIFRFFVKAQIVAKKVMLSFSPYFSFLSKWNILTFYEFE